ncbi:MAG TPA: cytochrome b N-terminal domain-containing protein [Anaeromyxobacteraceae bacterium]|nr:cytochrome b N-terminal domain-containing protein [Anaeromyxobacteraceae bacterium]
MAGDGSEARGAALAPERRPSGFSNLVLHLHPRLVPLEALRFTRTFGLGGAALVLFLLLAATGAQLLVSYEPSPERAYGTVTALVDEVHFGAFVRNAHHWAANGLVLVAFLHVLRVFYRGGHLPPRRGNWLVGLALLLLVVASAFTGYLLPWDQLAYWAVTISTGMLEYVPLLGGALLRAARGGPEIGPATLARFFVLHVAILPAVLLALLAFHFWLVRKVGGVVLPEGVGDAASPRGPLLPTSPALTRREGTVALVVTAAVLLLSAVADAPLLAQANPGMSPNPAKAPWYFMGVQELLVHVHPLFAAVIVPALTLALLAALPSLGGGGATTGRWFGSPRGARSAAGAAISGAALAAGAILLDEPLRRGAPWFPQLAPALRGGLFPVLAAGAAVAAVVALVRRRGASRLEATQAAFTFVLAAFAVLTVAGVLFRGPGMALAWPWSPPS